MDASNALFFQGLIQATSPCASRADCGSDYLLLGITTQQLRANRVARLWGKPISNAIWDYYLTDDVYPGQKISLGERSSLSDGQIIQVPGYFVAHKVQLYERPIRMPCY